MDISRRLHCLAYRWLLSLYGLGSRGGQIYTILDQTVYVTYTGRILLR